MTKDIKFAMCLVRNMLDNNGQPSDAAIEEISKLICEEAENKYTTLLQHCKTIVKILNRAISQMEDSK